MREVPFGRPIIGDEEKKAVMAVLDTPVLTHGPRVKEFEKLFAEFTGAPHAIATGSCTASLHLAYLGKELGPGDEVIVPAQTHTATGHAVEYTGAKAVFCDVDRTTGNINIDQIESLITENTRAISVVHFLGVPVYMPKVMEIAEKHDLFVVEDCALAVGTMLEGKHVGLFGECGTFSFYPIKHITTGEGGMTITRKDDLAASTSMLRAFGIDKNVVTERKVPGMYSVEKLGFNYRLNEMGAAIGCKQMDRLPDILKKRKDNFTTLSGLLAELDELYVLGTEPFEGENSYYALAAVLKEGTWERRFEIVEELKAKGVGTSTYYPSPVPIMPYYKNKYGYTEDTFPGACEISYRSITLPVGPHVDEEDMQYIVECLKEAIQNTK